MYVVAHQEQHNSHVQSKLDFYLFRMPHYSADLLIFKPFKHFDSFLFTCAFYLIPSFSVLYHVARSSLVFCCFRLGIKACAVLIPLLGVTWLLGLLSPLHKAFVYIFTILNSAQVSFLVLDSTYFYNCFKLFFYVKNCIAGKRIFDGALRAQYCSVS